MHPVCKEIYSDWCIHSSWGQFNKWSFLKPQNIFRYIREEIYTYYRAVDLVKEKELFLAGFLGELISRNGSEKNFYQIGGNINIIVIQ